MGKFDEYNHSNGNLVYPLMQQTDADIVILLLYSVDGGENHIECACPPQLLQRGVDMMLECAARMQETINKLKT